eukprot:1507732-Alexandrium_andersonii.AAC.1
MASPRGCRTSALRLHGVVLRVLRLHGESTVPLASRWALQLCRHSVGTSLWTRDSHLMGNTLKR